jgi:hypothetical protein
VITKKGSKAKVELTNKVEAHKCANNCFLLICCAGWCSENAKEASD